MAVVWYSRGFLERKEILPVPNSKSSSAEEPFSMIAKAAQVISEKIAASTSLEDKEKRSSLEATIVTVG